MASRGFYSTRPSKAASRFWWRYFLPALLAVISFMLLILSLSSVPAVQKFRMTLTDTIVPVLQLLHWPVDQINSSGEIAGSWLYVHRDNERLRSENTALLKWQEKARQLQIENQTLRALLNLAPEGENRLLTARILANNNGPYAASLMINAGSDQGVVNDQAVLGEAGLIGRVIEHGKKSSWVLLLSDINSRIPVIAEASRERAILAGQGNGRMELIYVAKNNKLEVGERIVTASDGGALPYGIPVGEVVRIEKNRVIVIPYEKSHRIDIVQLVANQPAQSIQDTNIEKSE